jgi:NitT/TauT family transport system substrate-binding protein
MLNRRATFGLTMLAGVALLVASCSSSGGDKGSGGGGGGGTPGSGAKKKVTIMLGGLAMTQAPFYVAQKEGFFGDNSLDANITVSPNGVTTAISAAVGGSVLVSVFGAGGAIPAIEKGAPMKVVGVTVLGYNSAIVVNTDYAKKHSLSLTASLADRVKAMQGAKIGIYTAGGSDEQLVRYLFNYYKLPIGNTRFVPLGDQAGLLAGLTRGAVDFTAASSPLDAHAVEGGKGERYILSTDLTPLARYPYSVAVASTGTIKGKADQLQGLLAAFTKACGFMKSDPDKAKADLKSTFSGLSDTDFNAEFQSEVNALPDSTVLSDQDFSVLKSFYKTSSGSDLKLSREQLFATVGG